MSDRKLTDSGKKVHPTHIALGLGVRLSDVESALARAGLALMRDAATGVPVIRDIPPIIASRFGRTR